MRPVAEGRDTSGTIAANGHAAQQAAPISKGLATLRAVPRARDRLSAALADHRRGGQIVILRPEGKTPLLAGWRKHPPSADQLTKCWLGWSNYGVMPGRWVEIDDDDGGRALERLTEEIGCPIPPGYRIVTRKGVRVRLALPKHVYIRGKVRVREKLDIIGHIGSPCYGVGVCSEVPADDGTVHRYHWLAGRRPDDRSLDPAPPALLDCLDRQGLLIRRTATSEDGVALAEQIVKALLTRPGTRRGGDAEISFQCPYHHDRRPSASYRPDPRGGVWHCFVCDAHGHGVELARALAIAPSAPSPAISPEIVSAISNCQWRGRTGVRNLTVLRVVGALAAKWCGGAFEASTEYVALKAGVRTRQTARRALTALVNAGWLVRLRPGDGLGGESGALWALQVPASMRNLRQCVKNDPTSCPPPVGEGVGSLMTHWVQPLFGRSELGTYAAALIMRLDAGEAFPSVRAAARALGAPEATIRRVVEKMEAVGLLMRSGRTAHGGCIVRRGPASLSALNEGAQARRDMLAEQFARAKIVRRKQAEENVTARRNEKTAAAREGPRRRLALRDQNAIVEADPDGPVRRKDAVVCAKAS